MVMDDFQFESWRETYTAYENTSPAADPDYPPLATQVRSTAAAEDIKPRHLCFDRPVLISKFDRVAIVKRFGFVEFSMALAGGVTAYATRPLGTG